ncbi:potassium/proton antiporter [Aerophototrophica crusticola]|uniref:Potassium/proton antiporter n=1 Tax=Aerophototrophica crusticola TaxID=1709002 RepID=A0A858R406_9PROT|nr:potassium/proton antiporter [Rhodospirillaceae bacterium B3]
MELVNHIILLAGLLLLLAIFAGQVSSRIGAPVLLVFLALGMLAGEDGYGIFFNDYQLAYLIGSLALAVILFDGGLRTRAETFKLARWPALSLATVGVVVTAGVTGLAAALALDLGWREGLLVGAIVASTDAAAVFFLLHLRGLGLRARVSATLEVESGLNDPMAVLLTVVAITLVTAPGPISGWHLALEFVLEMGGGAALGVIAGFALVGLVNRLELADGLYPILALSAALFVYGLAQALGTSGFMAVYLAGFILGNKRHKADRLIRRFHDGLAWLAQITLFVMLGLLVTPSKLEPFAAEAVLVALALVFLARPLAVFISLAPLRFSWGELWFMSWVGLRGAVPIVLGTMPVLAGVPGAETYFGIAFVVVLVSLVVQGWTVGLAARLLGMLAPAEPEAPTRADFDLAGEEGRQLAVFTVAPDSEAATRTRGRLLIPENVQVLTLIQNGCPVRPEDAAGLQPGDAVLCLGDPPALAVMDRLFGRRAAGVAQRQGIGDFQLQADTPAREVGLLYGFDPGPDGDLMLGAFLAKRLGRTPALGDRARAGEVELVAAQMDGDRLVQVGIDLTPEEERGWSRVKTRLAGFRRRPKQAPLEAAE